MALPLRTFHVYRFRNGVKEFWMNARGKSARQLRQAIHWYRQDIPESEILVTSPPEPKEPSMLTINIRLEDSILIANYNHETNKWDGFVTDLLSRKVQEFSGWSGPQMASLCGLSVCGGELPQPVVDGMYAAVEPLIKDWPPECRTIP
jgi:hypothetical protein